MPKSVGVRTHPCNNPPFDGEGVRGGAMMLDGASYFLTEGCDQSQELGRGGSLFCAGV